MTTRRRSVAADRDGQRREALLAYRCNSAGVIVATSPRGGTRNQVVGAARAGIGAGDPLAELGALVADGLPVHCRRCRSWR